MAELDGLTDADTTLAYLPPAWIGQSMFGYAQPLVVGACIACPESSETMLADLREIGPTCFYAPPRVLKTLASEVTTRMEDAGAIKRRLYTDALALARRIATDELAGQGDGAGEGLRRRLYDGLIYGPLRDVLGMSRLRVAYTSSEPLGGELLGFFRAIGVNLKQLYGSAETGLFVCTHRDGQVRAGTVGPALPGVALKLGARDEVLVRSPGLFVGYHGDAQATQRAKDADGWYHTGDAGQIGADGQLRIIGRLDAIGALADGSAFVPAQVEGRLEASPLVKAAVAVGAGRDRVCAILHVDATALGDWANRRSLTHTGIADLAGRPEVAAVLGEWIAQVNAGLAADPAFSRSQVHRFVVLPEDAADDGAPSAAPGATQERYRALVDAMYAGAAGVRPDDEPPHDGARTGTAPADLRIHDARTAPTGASRGAAAAAGSSDSLLKEAA